MHSMDNLKKLLSLSKHAKEGMDAYMTFNKAAMSDGAIPQKYKELIAIAVSLTTQCVYCLEVHKKAALAAGATESELAETALVAASIRAGGAITHSTHLF